MPLHELLTKLWALFDQADRCRLLGILAFMLLGTLLEILGVGLIVPVVAVLSDPEAVQEIPQLRAIHESFGSPTPRTFLMWSLGGLLGVFVFKNLFLFVSYYIQFKFIFRKHADIAGRLLGSYLRRPYVFHLQKNTADLVRNISSELPSMISGFFIPAFLLVSESLVFLGLILLALLASPLITLVTTGLLGFALWLFYAAFRPRLAKWGKRVQQHGGEMIQQVQQGLGGIKEVKLFGCEEHVTKSFIRHAQGFTRNAGYHSTLSQSSRLVVETLMVGALLGVVIVLVSGTTQASIILPTLALYAAIAFRLMPSANRLIGAATSIRYTSRALEVIHADLTAATPSRKIPLDDATTLPFTHAIELHDVTFKYEASHQPALQKINLQIKHGTMVGFQGESGAGKTTLVDLVLGLIEPDAGQVLVDGLPINKNLPGWQRQIGYVPQSVYLTDDTLRRNIAFGLADADIDDDRVWQALQQAQLGSFIHEKPDKLETRVGEQGTRLSGGQLQRIGIARALYHNPDVLVLDEATAALDVKTEARFIEVIRFLKGKKTILIISHRLSTLRHCDEQHRLCQGRLETLKTAPNKALQI